MTQVKICGITTPEALRRAAELQVEYIGLVFAPSRRRVEPETAGRLITELRSWRQEQPYSGGASAAREEAAKPQVVGVFVDPPMDELDRALAAAPLDVVQLHGQESPEFCRAVRERFGVRVFKASSIREDGSFSGSGQEAEDGLTVDHAKRAASIAAAYQGTVDTLLIDTHDPLYGGGSGRTFNWEIIPLYQKAAHARGLKLFVAGGLNPGNAGELIRHYKPDGVDVSSGVETDGHKDLHKMTLFAERVALS
ncbi:N-(5'-phosphoribosyl)anthranilate isomerase [Saccharibacillus sp. O16]|nr:N-(5'-phosphoribosyl)anthranilate isomerase [Saccharibacillus sp. O16]